MGVCPALEFVGFRRTHEDELQRIIGRFHDEETLSARLNQVRVFALRASMGGFELDTRPFLDFGAAPKPALLLHVDVRFPAAQLVPVPEQIRAHASIERLVQVPSCSIHQIDSGSYRMR